MPKKLEQLNLDRVVFYGRSLAEYQRFFNLDLASLAGQTVLDCPSGAASFAAETAQFGINVIAVDPFFSQPMEKLRAVGQADIEHVMEEVEKVWHLYDSGYFASVEEVRATRQRSLELFCADFRAGKTAGRYVAALLPGLPFADGQFDLVLSGHFLFIYDDRFNYDFHLAAIRELARISSGEVRIFPPRRMDRQPYPQLDQLRHDLEQQGIVSELRPSNFEFVKGWKDLLVLHHGHQAENREGNLARPAV